MAKIVMQDALLSYANPKEEIILIPRVYVFFTSNFLRMLKIQTETQPTNFIFT